MITKADSFGIKKMAGIRFARISAIIQKRLNILKQIAEANAQQVSVQRIHADTEIGRGGD